MQKTDFNRDWTVQKDGSTEILHVNLPDDAMIREERSKENKTASASAYFAGGKYIYTKIFNLSEDETRQTLILEFEAVYQNAIVFLNGRQVAERPYGYTNFFVDITGKVIAGTRAKKVRSKSYNAFSSIDFPCLAMIQDGNIMRYIPPVPYEEEVWFYEELDENVYLIKMIPGIKPRILRSVFENYDCIIVESFGVGGIPRSIADDFYKLCQEFPDRLVVMSTQVAHEGSDMTVYEVGHDMKKYCRFLESYDMTLESVIAKVMWMLGNREALGGNLEDIFYQNVNYDVIFGKNRKC